MTGAKYAVKQFGLFLEREFWDMCYEPLRQYERTGVKMHILGKEGICTVFPVLAYFVGDGPARHRYSLVYEGNANMSCIRCLYNPKTDGIFDADVQVLRDAVAILNDQHVTEPALIRKQSGGHCTVQEIYAENSLKDQCVHRILTPTAGVPMGWLSADQGNNVFQSPCDILHTFMCGLIKNVVLWTTFIVSAVSKVSPRFKRGLGILDSRIASMNDFCDMPNITWSYFRKGVSFISKCKGKKDNLKSTGSAGGFRSCEYVSMLFQIFLAVR